jgi:hypothetical protein
VQGKLTVAADEERYEVPCSLLEDLKGVEECNTTKEDDENDSSRGGGIVVIKFKLIIRIDHPNVLRCTFEAAENAIVKGEG